MVKTFKEMTLQELMQVDYCNYEQGLLIALCEELLSRMVNPSRTVPTYQHPDALKVTC